MSVSSRAIREVIDPLPWARSAVFTSPSKAAYELQTPDKCRGPGLLHSHGHSCRVVSDLDSGFLPTQILG